MKYNNLNKKNLLVDFDNIGENIQWEKAYATYQKNIDIFEKIIDRMVKKYDISFIVARDSILYELVFLQVNASNIKSFESKSYLKWVLIYIFTMIGLFLNSIISFFIGFFEKKQNCKVMFEELWEDNSLYSRYYKYIVEQLSELKDYALLYNTPSVLIRNIFSENIQEYNGKIINRRYRNVFYDFKISIKVLSNNILYIFKLYKYSKINKINFIYLYLRFLRKLLTYTSQVSSINSEIIISASDYYWNPIKYFAYKKKINNIILLQHNYKSTQMWQRLFPYCDIHYTHSNDASDKIIGVTCSTKIAVGSFQLIPFLKKEKIEYDILFINQTVHDNLLSTTPTLNQKKLIEQHDILVKHFKEYLTQHSEVKALFIAKGTILNETYMQLKPAVDIKISFSELKNIDFVSSLGSNTMKLIKTSKLIINMYSSVGFESYGLDKKVLWINYNHCTDVMGFETENEDLHIMINNTSYEAFEERVNLLLSENKEVDKHYKKLKEKYMNIQENPAKIVADKINELIDKDK